MVVPDWYSFLLLGLAAWSVFQLLAHDDILDRPRRYVLRLGHDWEKDGDPVPDEYRIEWALFLTCPYCAGFWIWLAWYGAFQISEFWTLVAAAALGGRALVVAGAKTLAKEEDKSDQTAAAIRELAAEIRKK